jgi:hypothetical protein
MLAGAAARFSRAPAGLFARHLALRTFPEPSTERVDDPAATAAAAGDAMVPGLPPAARPKAGFSQAM